MRPLLWFVGGQATVESHVLWPLYVSAQSTVDVGRNAGMWPGS